VLFVGNSYTYAGDIPWLTAHLANSYSSPRQIEVEMIASAGLTLKDHWEKGEVLKSLRKKHWDFVVLQEQSEVPITILKSY
jgi:hypothetical protein